MPTDQRRSLPVIDGEHLTLEAVETVARQRQHAPLIDVGSEVYQRMEASRAWVEQAVARNAELTEVGGEARAYYGINTGFGIHAAGRPMTQVEQSRQASRKLIASHATGVGEYLDDEVVRAAMLIRANTLAKGRSGIRPEVINLLIEMLNRDVLPRIPCMGSLGASGDLAPLAHLALVMSKLPDSLSEEEPSPGFASPSGEASVPVSGAIEGMPDRRVIPGAEAMQWDGIDRRVVLEAKEGLALNNGATISAALASLAIVDAENLVRHAEIVTALSLEALMGYRDAFLPQLHQVRPHPGQIATASNVLSLVEGSRFPDPGQADHDPVRQPPQDPYSLRCAPQVIGAVRETLAHNRETLEREINSATDNPLIFVQPEDLLPRDYKAISGGNFHGEHIAFAMDHLSIALTELGSISERRTFWLTNAHMSRGLPSMLVEGNDTFIDSGLMITQYVAASLVSKCKTLAHPDSVDSIPSSANQEDHVSMSMNAALHAREIVENITSVLAIELLAAVTGMRHRLNALNLSVEDLGNGTRIVLAALQNAAPAIFQLPLNRDVVVYPYLRLAEDVVKSGTLVDSLQESGFRFREVRSLTTVQ